GSLGAAAVPGKQPGAFCWPPPYFRTNAPSSRPPALSVVVPAPSLLAPHARTHAPGGAPPSPSADSVAQ
ncbi:unnamed protein product, partial [Amoebophrya sp. A120]